MPKKIKVPVSSLPELQKAHEETEKALKKQKRDAKSKQAYENKMHTRNHRGKQDHYLTDSTIEDDMIAAVDFRKEMGTMRTILAKLVEDKYDPTSFFQGISKYAAAELASVAFTGEKEKNRLDALKHLLSLGGHTATQKHEISRMDPATPKEALLAHIMGGRKDLAEEGIEIVDDSEDYDK